jgi:hypothetical protein
VRHILAFVLLISLPCWTQTTTTGQASTNEPCSVANTGAANKIQITCGIGREQGQKILAILNKILTNQLNLDVVMTKLDDIQNGVAQIRKQEEFEGLLTPANEPTPENVCSSFVPDGAMLLLVGNSATFATKSSETVIQIGNENMLVMEKISGRIAISAKLFSSDGRIVAQLDKNQFFINPNNYFRKEISADGHSLVVLDQSGIEVLNVRFLNPTTLSFLGVIRHPTGNLEISKTHGWFSNRMCAGDAGGAGWHFGPPS